MAIITESLQEKFLLTAFVLFGEGMDCAIQLVSKCLSSFNSRYPIHL